MLKRVAYPYRYSDMIPIFGRSVSDISMISNEVLAWMYTNHGHRVIQWNHAILNSASLNTYADAIHNKGDIIESLNHEEAKGLMAVNHRYLLRNS